MEYDQFFEDEYSGGGLDGWAGWLRRSSPGQLKRAVSTVAGAQTVDTGRRDVRDQRQTVEAQVPDTWEYLTATSGHRARPSS